MALTSRDHAILPSRWKGRKRTPDDYGAVGMGPIHDDHKSHESLSEGKTGNGAEAGSGRAL
ncbi:Protein of unknown function [Azospirillum lipoferum 4B]|uniref:Uncharacterized protein n=1 Tax=Azospirillum lipoferum (strain 4B) TaxID=862719 RepID=G7Z688_AZOL4|nr:Protein of unknown function [Azospirillum lipoferum 4B]